MALYRSPEFKKSCFSNQLPWQQEFCRDFNSFIYFQKGPPKKHCNQFIMKSNQYFKPRRFNYIYIGKKEPRPLAAMFFFLTNQDKNVNFVRGLTNNYFCKIILKSDHWLSFYKFFQVFPIGCHGNQSYAGISILLAIFRKDHPMNISTNLC